MPDILAFAALIERDDISSRHTLYSGITRMTSSVRLLSSSADFSCLLLYSCIISSYWELLNAKTKSSLID